MPMIEHYAPAAQGISPTLARIEILLIVLLVWILYVSICIRKMVTKMYDRVRRYVPASSQRQDE
jgi:beta-lactamase regulating signal transducer with metallopeptidase domain